MRVFFIGLVGMSPSRACCPPLISSHHSPFVTARDDGWHHTCPDSSLSVLSFTCLLYNVVMIEVQNRRPDSISTSFCPKHHQSPPH